MSGRRPWRRTAIKLGAMVLGRKYRHFHNWMPHLQIQIEPGSRQRVIRYRGRTVVTLRPFSILGNAAREIVVVGSGPSVRSTDFSNLPPQSVMLLNGAISLVPDRIANPLAAVIEDERFIWKHFSMLRDHLSKTVPLILSVSVIRSICEIDPAFLSERQVILIDDLRKPYGKPRRDPKLLETLSFTSISSNGAYGFSSDPDQGVFMGHSVAVSATQFAVACNPEIVGFAGIDLSNDTEPRFYEKAGRGEPSSIAGSIEVILGHISLARDCATERGIEFRNYSPTSALALIGIAYQPTLRSG